MRGNRIAATLLGLLLSLAAAQAGAAGFGLNEHGAKAMGLAGAYTAIADGPSATFFNPAGLATLSGLQLEVGMTLIAPSARYMGPAPEFEGDVTIDAVRHYFPLPNLHASYRIHERVAAGLAFFVPYGLTMEWPTTVNVGGTEVGWWGRGLVEKIALQTFFFSPQIAVNLHPRVQIGAGLYIVPANVELRRQVTFSSNPADDITVELGATDLGFGATAGLLVSVIPELLNAGFTYRGGVSFTFEGNAGFTRNGSAEGIPAGIRSRLTDGPAQAKLNLPHVFSFGLATFPIKPLTIGFVFDVITWSDYDQLAVTFLPTAEAPGRGELSSVEPKEWSNTIAVRLGAEYKIIDPLAVRVGFIYDQGPPPLTTMGPELPDADRYEFTVGAGYAWRGLRVDLAYQFLTTGDVRSADVSPLPATWRSNAHLVGLSLGYGLNL